MEIVCNTCQSKFKIADDKVPSDRSITVKCKKCDEKIEVGSQAKSVPEDKPEKAAVDKTGNKGSGSVSFDASEKPFDYLEEGIESALLCEHDLQVREHIHKILDKINYHVVEAASARNALKYMRFHTYDLVVVNEGFEATGNGMNHVLQYLSQLPVGIRRDIFVILLSKKIRTMDNMAAFNKSVNLVVNLENVGDMKRVLKGALSEHQAFYKVFRESLVATGHA
jgi:predicted Zn finger-like uncharacterized protein